ncbi:MAG: ABC transporter permease [Clostridia bacterium]|nr:ABC transporter permease [Clostridia bacterium]
MIAMVRYELKKVFGSVGGKIALILYIAVLALSCWLSSTGATNIEVKWVNEQGKSEYGLTAVQNLRDAQKKWEGWVDQETLTRVIQENQRIDATPEANSDSVQQRDIAYSWKQGFMPIREMVNHSYADDFRKYDYYTADRMTSIDVDAFYANREKLLTDWLYDETDAGYSMYSEPEKQYIIGQYRQLQTPFYFTYHEGWHQLLENAGYIPSLGILILGFLLAGIFSNEFKWKADAMYFSTLCGRNKATSAKIKAGFLLVTVLYWGAMLIYSLFTLCYLGFEGGNCVIQWLLWKSIYNLNMWQAWMLALVSGYIGNLFLALLTMWISAKTKSAVFAVTTPFILVFLPAFLEGIPGWLSKISGLMPSHLLELYQNLGSFKILTVFGKVFRTLDVSIPLYLMLSIILVPMMYREYQRKRA